MPYEKKRLSGHGKILFHAVYSGIKYSQARQKLLRESGLRDEPIAANGKPVEKKAKAAK